MGILTSKQQKATPASAKRRSIQTDFSSLPPLKAGGTVGFSAYRQNGSSAATSKPRKRSNGGVTGAMEEDSDEDDEDIRTAKMEEVDDKDDKDSKSLLSPEDAKFSGELADGVGRIKVSFIISPFQDPLLTCQSAQAPALSRASECKLPQISRFYWYCFPRSNTRSRPGIVPDSTEQRLFWHRS